jgi:hypothetical protein
MLVVVKVDLWKPITLERPWVISVQFLTRLVDRLINVFNPPWYKWLSLVSVSVNHLNLVHSNVKIIIPTELDNSPLLNLS